MNWLIIPTTNCGGILFSSCPFVCPCYCQYVCLRRFVFPYYLKIPWHDSLNITHTHVHLRGTACKVMASDTLLQGQGGRSKVTYKEFVSAPYLLIPLSDYKNISHVHLIEAICRASFRHPD